MAKKRDLSIADRRRAAGSIFGTGSKPIPIKEPQKWVIRNVNSKVSNQHVYNMRAEKLWEFVTPADLDCTLDEIGYRELDGRVVRGERGEEVLMKMPKRDYQEIQHDKDTTNRKTTLGAKAAKETILGAMHGAGDEQGAEFMRRALRTAKIEDATERVSLEQD